MADGALMHQFINAMKALIELLAAVQDIDTESPRSIAHSITECKGTGVSDAVEVEEQGGAVARAGVPRAFSVRLRRRFRMLFVAWRL